MSTKKDKRAASKARGTRSLPVGNDTYLNRHTEHGLFEACNGNKYLITEDCGINIAVALSHRHLLPFTCQPLGLQPLEYGQWWGPCRLRLTHAVPRRDARMKLGTLGLMGPYATIDCRSAGGGTHGVPIGAIGAAPYGFRDFDAWALEPIELHYPFFERLRPGKAMWRPGKKRRALEFTLDQSVLSG